MNAGRWWVNAEVRSGTLLDQQQRWAGAVWEASVEGPHVALSNGRKPLPVGWELQPHAQLLDERIGHLHNKGRWAGLIKPLSYYSCSTDYPHRSMQGRLLQPHKHHQCPAQSPTQEPAIPA